MKANEMGGEHFKRYYHVWAQFISNGVSVITQGLKSSVSRLLRVAMVLDGVNQIQEYEGRRIYFNQTLTFS